VSAKTQAILLAGTIETATIEPTAMHRRASAPLYQRVANRHEPLDLEAAVFRYLVPHRCDKRRR
jgi:hypothetical protein